MEKTKSVTPEDRATFFADENYPAKFADNKWDALYTAYHSGYLDGSIYEREKQKELVEALREFCQAVRKSDEKYTDWVGTSEVYDALFKSESLLSKFEPNQS